MRRDTAVSDTAGRARRRVWAVVAMTGIIASSCSDGSDTASSDTAGPDTVPVDTNSPGSVAEPEPSSTVATDTSVAPTESNSTTPAPASPITEQQLTELVAADFARLGNAPGQIVSVLLPSRGLDLTVAVGNETLDGGAPLTADSTVRLTSVTKTYVAAATFRLIESGAIALDDSIAEAGVSTELLEVLRSDGYDVETITVGQLMAHTSGIADYAGSSDYSGSPYSARNFAEPLYEWTRQEQVRFAVDTYDPVAAPGEEFHYSDTNYILLGDLLEQQTDLGMGDAMRSLIGTAVFGPATTHVEMLEPTPAGAGPRAAQYFGTFDARDASPTIDLFGGGGLVASMPETARFFHALGTGGVFTEPETFATMSGVTAPGSQGGAASGLFRSEFAGVECFGHQGFYGTFAMVCPSIDFAFARAWNQAFLQDGADLQALAEAVVSAVR